MTLTIEQYAEAKGLPLDFLAGLGVKQEATEHGPRVIFPYRDPDGVEITARYRNSLNGDRYRFTWRKGAKTALYGLERLAEARSVGFVALVEGESDCHTLWFNSVPSLGVPGASNWQEERDARHFDGIPAIYVVIEPDRGGETLRASLTRSSLCNRVRFVSLPMSEKDPKKRLKDPSDLWLDNTARFRQRWQEALRSSTPSKKFQEKSRLKIDLGHPERTVENLRDILANSGRLYDRGTPVRVVQDHPLGGSVAHTLSADSLSLEAHFACQPYFVVKGTGEERDTTLPPSIARMYLGWKGEWRLPPLNGITTAPLLSEDGSIRTTSGYDAAMGLWCEKAPDVGDLVPPRPSRSQAEAALATVRDAFKTFCFADAETICGSDRVAIVDLRKPPGLDESSFLAALLGGVCRACLWLAPGALFRAAPHSGSGAGKGKLARCICAVAYGRQPSAVTAGGGAQEMEKRISAALLEGGPAVLFDNFNNVTLRSASLESALTERPAKVRQFRTLDLMTLNALASVFVTGNGVLLAQDIVRRFIPTEFDARMEDPERRSFSGDILTEMTCRRPELLAALLTIWRYGRVAGDIKLGKTLGSYEQWCSWVRDPLLALGCRDPVERMSAVKARDPFRQTIGALFAVWWTHHGSVPQTAHQLDVEVQRTIDPQSRGRQYIAAQLEKLDGTRLGGFRLTRQRGLSLYAVATYALQKTSNDNSTWQSDDTHDADACVLGSEKNAADDPSGDEISPNQAGRHRHHADHQLDRWNTSPDRDGLI
jgi:hypothetical protein